METRNSLRLATRLRAEGPAPWRKEPGADQSATTASTTNDASVRRLLKSEVGPERIPPRWNLKTGEGAQSMPDLGSGGEVWKGPNNDHRYNQHRGGWFELDKDQGPRAFDRHILRAPAP